VREYVALSLSAPAVPVTWIIYVPLGVVGPPPQPFIPMNASVANRIALLSVNRSRRSFWFFAPRSGSSRNPASAPAISSDARKGGRAAVGREGSVKSAAELGFRFVAMVSVEVAVPVLPGVTLGEEKLHVASLGSPLHARVVAALKPFAEVTVTVTTASSQSFKAASISAVY